MSEQDIKDCNLIVIAVVEGFAQKHQMKASEVLQLFGQYNVLKLLRSQYDVLHTLDFDEAEEFAEDLLRGRVA